MGTYPLVPLECGGAALAELHALENGVGEFLLYSCHFLVSSRVLIGAEDQYCSEPRPGTQAITLLWMRTQSYERSINRRETEDANNG
jgi:hypothetical protein